MIYLVPVPEAKSCHSQHDYKLGPRESKRRSGNIGIYFKRLVQVMEGERENTRPPEKRNKKKKPKTRKRKCSAPRKMEKKEDNC